MNKEEFLKKEPIFSFVLNAHFGGGKTHAACTFPKFYHISFITHDLDILYRKANSRLLANLVESDILSPSTDDDLRSALRSAKDKLGKRGVLFEYLDKADRLAKEGKIKTLIIDGFTYFSDLLWRLINIDEKIRSEKTGNIDTQAMYRNLGIYLTRFVARDLIPIAVRNRINLVICCHLKRESEETLEGGRMRAGKVDKMSDIAPMIEGGFRNKIEGLVGASIYLDKKIEGGKVVHIAYCDKTPGLQTIVNAKNRYGLPPIIRDFSYDVLMKHMDLKQP